MERYVANEDFWGSQVFDTTKPLLSYPGCFEDICTCRTFADAMRIADALNVQEKRLQASGEDHF